MGSKPSARRRRHTGRTWELWVLLLPSLILLLVFTVLPIVRVLRQSLYQEDIVLATAQFVGFANYRALGADEVFWKVIVNSFVYALGMVPCSIALAIIMALLVNRAFKGNTLVRSLFFYPVILPLVAVANIWLYLYSSDGVISAVLSALHITDQNLLSSPSTVKIAIIAMLIWKDASFYMVFYLAALKNLPQDVFEAAALDGAHGWRLFWSMTFPLMMPTTMFCLVMSTADAFHLIDHLIVMTQGGPNNSSSSLLYYVYQVSFQFIDSNKASTVTAVLLLVLFVIFTVQLFITGKQASYED